MRPAANEYFEYFDRYISLVPGEKVIPVLIEQMTAARQRLRGLTEEQAAFRYAPGKWSLREVVGHIIDTERVFGYRALWFARGNDVALPSFDQDPFVASSAHDRCSLDELVMEFCSLRHSHILMFDHLPKEAWGHVGTASDHPMSTRAAAFIMAGHVEHHLRLLKTDYKV